MTLYHVSIGVIPKPGTVRRQFPAGEPIEADTILEALAKGRELIIERGYDALDCNELKETGPGVYSNSDVFTYVMELGLYANHPLPYDLEAFVKERGGLLTFNGKDGYCVSNPREGSGKTYLDWERAVANPALKSIGCEIIGNDNWSTGDGDSFGPLERHIIVKHGDKFYEVSYG